MIQEIKNNLFCIPVPLPGNPLKELNAYLIKGEDRSLLIDTGFRMEACRKALEDGLRQTEVDRSTLDVLVTHIHTDHTGLSDVIRGPGRTVYVGELDYPFVDIEFDNWFWKEIDNRYLEEGFPQNELSALEDINPARTLGPELGLDCYTPIRDGEHLQIGEFDIEVISVPGHAPGQLCLWIEKEKILFTGDHVLFDITPNITMWPNYKNCLGHYLDSLKKIRSYPAQITLPAHRHSANLQDRVDQLLEHHRVRVLETLSIVNQRPGLTAYEVAGQMSWNIRVKGWKDFPLSQKWFAVGEGIAHLELLIEQKKISSKKENGCYRYYPA